MLRTIARCTALVLPATLLGCGFSSEVKSDPMFQEEGSIYTAAAAGDAVAFANYIQESDWDHTVADFNGVLPLCYAAQGGNLDIIQFMVQNGADVNMPDMKGKTPIQYAKDAGKEEAVEYLRQLGATE